MRRKLPTGRVTPVAGSPVRLFVDYENAADFLYDYADHLVHLEAAVQTERVVPPGTQVQLVLGFPGLVEPIVVEGIVRPHGEDESSWTHVGLLASATPRLAAIVERIRQGDKRVVVPVLRVLIAEDNTHVCELVKNGLTTATRRELRDIAFGFDTAADGGAALELLKRTTFDAAIVDIAQDLLLCDPVSGEEAERIGLVSLAVDGAQLLPKAYEVADRLAQGSQSAIRWTKYSLNNWLRQAGPAFDTSLALEFMGFAGPDVQEGIASLRDRRVPKFPTGPAR